jgi:hypothetical protein
MTKFIVMIPVLGLFCMSLSGCWEAVLAGGAAAGAGGMYLYDKDHDKSPSRTSSTSSKKTS